MAHLRSGGYLFQSRVSSECHISTRQYNPIFHGWIDKLGLDDSLYSTHSMRRTKPYLIYKKTKNLRVIQLLLGHKKLESTVRILALKSMMPWRYLNRLKSNMSGLQQQPCARSGRCKRMI
jgi:integrase